MEARLPGGIQSILAIRTTDWLTDSWGVVPVGGAISLRMIAGYRNAWLPVR